MSRLVVDNGDGTVTMSLKYPVKTDGGKVIESVTIRSPGTWADYRAYQRGKDEGEAASLLILSLSELSPSKFGISMSTLGKMHTSDVTVLAAAAVKAVVAEPEENDGGGKESPATGGPS